MNQQKADLLVHHCMFEFLLEAVSNPNSFVYVDAERPRRADDIERMHRAIRREMIRLFDRMKLEGPSGDLGETADRLLEQARRNERKRR